MPPRDDAAAAAEEAFETRAARFRRGFPAIALAIFLAAVDQTIVATALPAIAAELGEVRRVSWVVVAYLIAGTIAAPIHGRLGDVFGRRRALFAALAVHALGAFACAASGSLASLVAARVLQGFGGGGLLTLAIALIGEHLEPRERGRFQAWIAGCFVVASAVGPTLGGLLTQGFGWRAVFLLGPPLAALAASLAWRRLPGAVPGGSLAGGGGRFRFDAPGVALFTGFVAAALLGLDQAQRVSLAALPLAAGLAVLAGLALWALLSWERRAPDPLLPLGLLAEPAIWRANAMSAGVAGSLVGMVSFLPVYLQAVRGLPPAEVGLAMLPMSVGGGFGALFSGRMMLRTGRTMLWPSVGLVVAAGVLGLVAAGAGRLPTLWLPVVLGVASLGFGTSFPVAQTVVQVAAGRERLGIAAASVQLSRTLGAATGTALMGAVLFGALAAGGGDEAAALLRRLVAEGPGVLAALPPARAAAVRAELAGAFQAAFGAAAAMAAAAAVMAWRGPVRRV